MIKFQIFILIVVSVFFTQTIVCLNLCGDWTQYKDIKCINVLNKSGTEEEALKNCTQLDKSSTLLTIHSKEEQEFINNLLKSYQNIYNNAWIGMKYTDKEYKWMDGTDNDFTNWANDADRDGTVKCVQMSLFDKTIGKWMEESCKRTALIVCQNKQELNFNVLANLIQKMEDKIENQDKKFQEQKNIIENQKEINEVQDKKLNSFSNVPMGFIYTQFPNQSKPEDLWPNTKWSEITSQYSGLFFRAEGGGSETFGRIQQANQSWISNVFYWGERYDSFSGGHDYVKTTSLNQTQWVDISYHSNTAVYELQLYTTGGEVRPKNTAIKIWIRIQ